MVEYISREAVNNLIEDMQNNRLLLVCERTNLYILKSKVAELPAADVQILKCEKWKEILEILRDAVEELEYYETHGDILDRHIWKYKDKALALIGEGQ